MASDALRAMRARIKESLDGVSPEVFVRQKGASFAKNTLRNWIDGSTTPRVDDLQELASLTGRSLAFFLPLETDLEGAAGHDARAQLSDDVKAVERFATLDAAKKHLEMLPGEPSPGLLLALSEKFHVSLEHLLGLSDEPTVAPTLKRDKFASSVMFKPVRRLDVHAAAGAGALNHGFAVDSVLPFPRWMLQKLGATSAKLSFLRARGDSMEPTIKNGALLLIDEGDVTLRFPPPKAEPPWDHPDIYVFSRGDELRVKHLRRDKTKGLILALSDHPAYDAEIVRDSDIKIEGRVIWWDNRL